MRLLPEAMRRDLQAGVTHFCHCWSITRRDGRHVGLTDHDADVVFDGRSFHADAGLSLSAVDAQIGLDGPKPEASGVLSSRHLKTEDLAIGLYDEARFDLWLVDWRATDNRMLLMHGTFGPVRATEGRYAVRLKPAGADLERPEGRLYQQNCDAELGDARCRAVIAAAPFRVSVRIRQAQGPLLLTEKTPSDAGWFADGHVELPTGRRLAIRADTQNEEGRIVHLWADAPSQLSAGDEVILIAGCDKRPETCSEKFNNMINYQGFPSLSDERLLIGVGDPA